MLFLKHYIITLNAMQEIKKHMSHDKSHDFHMMFGEGVIAITTSSGYESSSPDEGHTLTFRLSPFFV